MFKISETNNTNIDLQQEKLDKLLLDLTNKKIDLEVIIGEIILMEKEKNRLGTYLLVNTIIFFTLFIGTTILIASESIPGFFIAKIIMMIFILPIITISFKNFIVSIKHYIENKQTNSGKNFSNNQYTLTNKIKKKKIILYKLREDIENDTQLITQLKSEINERENPIMQWY